MSRCVDGRTKPKLWKKAKRKAMAEACASKSRRCGAWDARIAQRAGRIYRKMGGGYCGQKTDTQRSLSRWTKEDWTTATGRKACQRVDGEIRCDRYLPKAAWSKLTEAQKSATRRKKRAAHRQFVPNTPAARRAGSKARRG